jgi:hypothetical protein
MGKISDIGWLTTLPTVSSHLKDLDFILTYMMTLFISMLH